MNYPTDDPTSAAELASAGMQQNAPNGIGQLGSLHALQTAPTDRELAADLRAKIEAALNVVVTEMNKAESASGLRASFQIARDGFGRNRIADISIMRLL